jgi:PPM family protein phosphatase
MSTSGPSPESDNGTFQNRLEVEYLTDQGLRRSNNQDSMAVMLAASKGVWQQRGDLLMVADGMGAHAAGELASKISTDTVPLVYQKLADRTPAEAVVAALEEANAQIHSRGETNPEFKGMGTTTTALVLLPYGALVAHVGDSRAYRLRGTRLEQLTFDHSWVWEMRAAAELKGQVPDFVPKNVITRSLGPSATVKVDLEGPHAIAPGDTFLMCSDGLSGQVKDEEMGMVLGAMPPAEAARALIDLANLRGGPDNITVIVAKTAGPIWSQSSAEAPQPRAALRPVPTAIWIALGVLTLAGLLLLWAQPGIGAAVVLLAAAVLGVGAWILRQSGEVKGPAMNDNRYGRGPYTAVVCPPSREFVRRLEETHRELRDAAARAEMNVDSQAYHAIHDRAVASDQAGDFPQAVRYYCQSLSFMVAEFKRQGKSQRGISRKGGTT